MAKAARSRGVLAVACLTLTLWSGVSRSDKAPSPSAPAAEAAGEDAEKARALFKEGRQLAAAKKYDQACLKFEESLKLSDGIGTQFNLADCWEQLGRTASAHALFSSVAEQSIKAGQKERSEVAKARASALEQKLSRLTVEVEEQDGELQIRRGQVLLEKSQWGTALPVDPGTYELTASAAGKKPWSSRVKVPAAPLVVSVSVPKLEAELAPTPPPAPKKPAQETKPKSAPVAEKEQATSTETPPAERDGGRRLKAGTILLGGVGVAGVVAGVTFALQYQTSNTDAAAVCRSGVDCTKEEVALYQELTEDARKARTLSYVSFAAGGLALGGAAIFYLVSGEEPRNGQGSALRAAPLVAADGSLGASLAGSF